MHSLRTRARPIDINKKIAVLRDTTNVTFDEDDKSAEEVSKNDYSV